MARTRLRAVLATVAATTLVLTACAADGDETTDETTTDDSTEDPDEDAGDAADDDAADDAAADGEPIRVGIITSTSGFLGAYGNAYLDGLEAGLDYATDGTGAVDGRPIEFEIVDDGGEPDQAISAAVDLVGQGVNILAGSVSSGVAVQMAPFAEENQILFISGPAATDAVTGINDYTFRSGRQTYQDVATAASLVDGSLEGSTVAVFAQDSEFGAANVAAVDAVLGERGAQVEAVEVPLSATEFTPFVQQVADVDPDLVFVAWAGDTTPAMWEAMEQQGVFENYTVTTGLAERATWPLYGPAGPDIQFLSHYYADAPDNPVNDALVEAVGDDADLFTPDGFVAAQMIVRAVSEGDVDDTDSMIAALEGWSFDGPKGSLEIRASDHALLQPMFTASMLNTDDDPAAIEVETIEELPPGDTAPPEAG